MNKLIFLLVVFAGFMACENESIQELPQEKIDVCHYNEENYSWHVINISANEWEGHQKHGDIMLVDADGDGWVSFDNECEPGGDCDDTNADVNPGVEEIVYNGVDDDCNPATPDDDLDEDGFLNADDCDDNNSDVNPGAEEICGDGIDNNCDGNVDENGFTFTCCGDLNFSNLELTFGQYGSDCFEYSCGGYTVSYVFFEVLDSEGNGIHFSAFAYDFTNYTCDVGSFDDYLIVVSTNNYQTNESCEDTYGCPSCVDSNVGPGNAELYYEALGFINNLATELGIEDSCTNGDRSSSADSVKNMQSMPDELKKIIEQRKSLLPSKK